jgi:LacI family transcriptional regulator
MAFASSRAVALTTIQQPRHDLGCQAFQLLLERIELGRQEPREVILPTQLIVRRTCGGAPPPAAQPPETTVAGAATTHNLSG